MVQVEFAASHGVLFEKDEFKQAIIYADNLDEVTQSHSKPKTTPATGQEGNVAT